MLNFNSKFPIRKINKKNKTSLLSLTLTGEIVGPLTIHGHYEIIFQSDTLLFTLYLPEFIYSVHIVFYISMLEPATFKTFSKRTQPASALAIINRKPEYEILQASL